MRPRRHDGIGGLAANPILIGAVTVLVAIVAVFLAYNANAGLPFVPTYNLNAVVISASGLIKGDDVRIGGVGVGYVSTISAMTESNRQVVAVLHLRLDKSIEPLPIDSTILVRPRSPLGLKYVEITRGTSRVGRAANTTIPLSNSTVPVELNNFFDMFNAPTRIAARANLDEFGTAFAARGSDLNQALGRLNPLVQKLEPVMRNILDPRTRWGQLFPALEQAAREVVPVAVVQGDLFVALDSTFLALSQATGAIQASISGGPPSLEVATRELPAQAQFIDDSAVLFHRFRPAFASLASASVNLAPAFATGTPALLRSPALNQRLVGVLNSLQTFAADPRTIPGFARLTETARILGPPIAFIVPAQTTCNYFSLFFRNLESSFSQGDNVGTFLRFGVLALPQLANSEAGPAAVPANGPIAGNIGSVSDDSFLHSNPYPNTAAPGQTHECEAGNETYAIHHQVIGNEPGNQSTSSEATKRFVK
jgi:virulence factor Mce-like protein